MDHLSQDLRPTMTPEESFCLVYAHDLSDGFMAFACDHSEVPALFPASFSCLSFSSMATWVS